MGSGIGTGFEVLTILCGCVCGMVVLAPTFLQKAVQGLLMKWNDLESQGS